MSEPVAVTKATLSPAHVASYVTGVIATLVAIGGLYLAHNLKATTAMAVVAAGTAVTIGLHIGQALGVCGLIAAGLITARRLQATGWAMASYVVWLTASGLVVVGIELLSRTI